MKPSEANITIPFSYSQEWQDGFGARGWKLDSTIGDPAVIAATSASGERIPTSVFVHDILDHYLCGLPMSGHRNEAIAVVQLSSRTGADPRADFAQMVDEDLMQGQVNGESLRCFLPPELLAQLPDKSLQGRALIDALCKRVGSELLRKKLIHHFYTIGKSGEKQAKQHYLANGLDYHKRHELGLALQQQLSEMDRCALLQGWESAHGEVLLSDHQCGYRIDSPRPAEFFTRY